MMTKSLANAMSGLQTMQNAMNVHSNNIANAQTPGYRRQEVLLQNRELGGVTNTVRSTFDAATATRMTQLNGLASETQAKAGSLSRLDDSLSTSAKSLSTMLTSFREALGAATDHPNDKSLRDVVAARAESLASEANSSLTQLDAQVEDLVQQQLDVKTAAEAKVKELVNLNKNAHMFPNNMEIRNLQAQAGRELADLVGGEIKFLANGQTTYTINGAMVVNEQSEPGNIPAKAGGKFAGLQSSEKSFRDFRNVLSTTLGDFTGALNSVNANGVDAAGNPGTDLFSFDGNTVKFVGNAASIAIDEAGGKNGANGRKMLGLDSLGRDVASLAAKAATKTKTAEAEFSSRATNLEFAVQEQDIREGVDLDQETVHLKQAQRLYEANAKVIQVQDSLFGTLLSIVA